MPVTVIRIRRIVARNKDGIANNVEVRTAKSPGSVAWSAPRLVCRGTRGAQSPQVLLHNGFYYLLHMGGSSEYRTQVFVSKDPFDFGPEAGRKIAELPVSAAEIIEADGATYISSLIPGYRGVRVARLTWRPGDASLEAVGDRP